MEDEFKTDEELAGNAPDDAGNEREDESDASEEEEQDASDADPDGDAGEDDGEDPDEEDPGLLKERLRIVEEKLDRRNQEVDRLKKDRKESPREKVASTEDPMLARLEARGFLDKEEQELIIRAAKLDGVTPIEAAQDELVLEKIERMRKVKKASRAIDGSSGGSRPAKKDVDYYIRNNKVPSDPELAAQRAERLAQMSQARR